MASPLKSVNPIPRAPLSLELRRLFLCAAAIVIAGCGGGDAGVTSPAPTLSVTTITVSAPGGTLQVGQAYQFTATPRDQNGATVAGVTINWSVTPSFVAGVNATGIVTPTSAGTATVVATSGGVSGNTSATFVNAPPSLQADVLMSGEIFLPVTTTVKQGGIVRFNFPPGILHNVIFANKAGAPTDIQQTQNQIVSRTFSTLGTFHFDCTIHPGMQGDIIVVP